MKKYKFDVVVTCQGNPRHNYCNTLIGALFTYAYKFLKLNKYGTMNFTLKQVFLDKNGEPLFKKDRE